MLRRYLSMMAPENTLGANLSRRAAMMLAVVAAFAGCESDSSDGGGKGGDDRPPVKSADEIEDEIAEELQHKPYSDLIVGQASINCPEIISDNLAADKTTECTAEDEAGNLTEFRVKSIRHGEQYEWSPGELTAGLAFGP
jgi:hypothetical protein